MDTVMTRHTVSVILLILLYVHMFSLKLKNLHFSTFTNNWLLNFSFMPSMFGTTRLASFAPEANDAETKLTRLDNRIGVIGRPLTMPAATFWMLPLYLSSYPLLFIHSRKLRPPLCGGTRANPHSPCPPLQPCCGSNSIWPSLGMLPRTTWELWWLSPWMPRLWWLELLVVVIMGIRQSLPHDRWWQEQDTAWPEHLQKCN